MDEAPDYIFLIGENGSGKPTLAELGYPDAPILLLGDDGVRSVPYDEAPQVELTRSFLHDPQRFLRHLLDLGLTRRCSGARRRSGRRR
jgi:predicted ATPase